MNLFSYIKERVSILDVVSEYVSLKPAGSYWKGLSPFRQEKTPSFTVSPARGIYYCFSTAQGGDAIDFIAKMENCSAIEAAQLLAERYHIELPAQVTVQTSGASTSKTERELHERACRIFAGWCQQQLSAGPLARAYLSERGIRDETIAIFQLGYCPGGSSALNSFVGEARKQGILTSDLMQANILTEGNSGLYNQFDERIVFPITDHLGRPRGFGGRVFRSGDERPKYYNSRDHELFKKKQTLYGLNQAKKAMQTTGEAYLVEGYMDCIAMAQAGYKNTVATLGTACTQEHLALLTRLCRQVFVLYDGDTAGQQAILRLAQLCWQVQLELMVIVLPPDEDPASLLARQGKLEKLTAPPQTLFSFFIAKLGNDFVRQPLNDKLKTMHDLLAAIAPLSDPLQRELLLQQTSAACGVPANLLMHELRKMQRDLPAARAETLAARQPVLDLEKKIFSVILSSGIHVCARDEALLLTHLSQPIQRLFDLLRGVAWDFAAFFAQLGDEDRQIVSALAVASPVATELAEAERTLQELLELLRRKKWREGVAGLKARLEQARGAGDEEAVQKMLTDLRILRETLLGGGPL